MDDGSTDATASVLSGFAAREPRLKIISTPNRGLPAARNAGLGAASGEWVAFVDADDELDPAFLSSLVSAAEAARADFAIAPMLVRPSPDAPFETLPLAAGYNLRSGAAIRRVFLPRVLGYQAGAVAARMAGRDITTGFRELGSVCRCIYRRALVEKRRLRFDESLPFHEDAHFNALFALHAVRMAAVETPLYRYSIRPGGMTRDIAETVKGVRGRYLNVKARMELDRLCRGRLFPLFAGSCLFAAAKAAALALRHPSLRALAYALRCMSCGAVFRALALLAFRRRPLPGYAHPAGT